MIKGRNPMTIEPTRAAVAYIRVSTDEQANEGVSIEAQEAAVRAYCTMRGMERQDSWW